MYCFYTEETLPYQNQVGLIMTDTLPGVYIFVTVVIWRSHMMEIKAYSNDGSLVFVKHRAEAVIIQGSCAM